jgi:diketogulonate reductase-like aldo/keto reductase
MHAQKLTRSISVSNFNSNQLDCVLEKAKIKPVVNQLPYSVAYHPGDAIAENNKRGLLVQAWAPLGGSLGGRFDKNVKSACAKIGKNHGNKSFAQVGSFVRMESHVLCGFRVDLIRCVTLDDTLLTNTLNTNQTFR